MALCPVCERALPTNGNCMYCGKLDTKGAYKKPGRGMGPWGKYLIKFAIAAGLCGFAFWLIATEGGANFAASIKQKLGIGASDDSDDNPWFATMKKHHPKLKEMINNKLNYQIEDETIEGDASTRRIAIQRKGGTEFMQWVFIVNKDSGEVRGENVEAQSLLLER